MSARWKRPARLAVSIGATAILVLEVFRIMAKNSANLGVVGGKLRPCPDAPNCVCSTDRAAPHHIEPLAFTGDPDAAMSRLKAVLADQTRTHLVAEEADYLHAECTSLVFRFVDDLEFHLDHPGKKIHVRSASRAGKYDFGVNRRRVEAIRRHSTGILDVYSHSGLGLARSRTLSTGSRRRQRRSRRWAKPVEKSS
jgi:uncharacterized protein (DUF1499 family)